MEWAPIGPHQARPIGPHFGYCMYVWAKLDLGFWAVYWVWSGPQLGPSQQAQLGPTLDSVWICGLNWAWVSLGVHWQDRITNARILEQADTTSIEAHIVRPQVSWAGHVRRMPDTRVPKQLLYAELSSGKRKTGGQWKRYKDQLKANLKKCEMDLQWETTADDRAYWRRTYSVSSDWYDNCLTHFDKF